MNYGQVAQAILPYAIDAIAPHVVNAVSGATAPTYGTGQVNNALVSNTNYTQGKTRQQLQYEENLRQQRAGFDQGQTQAQQAYTANMANAAANANNARQMAGNAQMTLNNVYQQAGDRLNTAAANTMTAINNAGNIAAGMFR